MKQEEAREILGTHRGCCRAASDGCLTRIILGGIQGKLVWKRSRSAVDLYCLGKDETVVRLAIT